MHHNFTKLQSTFLDPLQTDENPQVIARNILKLSDQYMQFGKDLSSIWQDDDLVQAYLNYYLPLNLLRLKSVALEALSTNFFDDLSQLTDIGSGPGTTDFALSDCSINFEKKIFIDKSKRAQTLHQNLAQQLKLPMSQSRWSDAPPKKFGSKDLIVLSYALSEIKTLPETFFEAEALLILEPSTRTAGRHLQELRAALIPKGYHVWAPCTHQLGCPLLLNSKNDWCHQRIHIEPNEFLKKIETHLPIKNQTLTYSYLCARKKVPPATSQIRIIGDTLYENGKVKQAMCRGPDREFLTWLTRHGKPATIERGRKVEMPPNFEKKGDEIRVTTNSK